VPDSAATGTAPLTWVVLGDKPGDNAQVESIVQALPWQCERRYIQVLDEFIFGKPRVGPTLYHIDRERSDPLEPPWPDLILTSGRRPANVAMWIREQSGGRTRIVFIGKPSSMPQDYDLIIYSAEHQFPPLPNLQPITLPLMRVDEAQVAAAASEWNERLADLPRPLTAFLIGGPTGPFVLDKTATSRLLDTIDRIIRGTGGSAFITTSRRTPPAAVATLQAKLPPRSRLFVWTADASENPYHALLGLADGFVVTGDSFSMMVEVIRMHKPLAILPLPFSTTGKLDQIRRNFSRWMFAPRCATALDRIRQRIARALNTLRILKPVRDFTAFHNMLVARGLAVHAGEPLRAPEGEVPDDLAIAVQRIVALVEKP
jgi:mitochondrial fission protein ELM1